MSPRQVWRLGVEGAARGGGQVGLMEETEKKQAGKQILKLAQWAPGSHMSTQLG